MNPNATMLPSMRLDGQIALVTGAGRGIGRGCALALAEAGAEVIAMSRTADEIEAVAAEIGAKGGRARAMVCDVTDTPAVRRTVAGLGRLDVLVNNAGTAIMGPFLEFDDAALDTMLQLNARAVFVVAQEAARLMAGHGGGAIVNISSQYGIVGAPGNSIYAGTKHFIVGLSKSMAVELAPLNIRVNTVGPTVTETPMIEALMASGDSVKESVLGRIPMGRLGQVEDVVGAVVFLASPAAALITGATLVVDGGWTAQ
ncbi:MAG: glucose 1-dehydrogenase [Alphaproteobacteria bacterium]|nr:glucose 1-dehydrogenase [Alphaproteobacteria bacterium]MDP6623716.1 glucose 1-dehydrogenase [Alphaproteobacteria bacterium]|tara:strand:+ start:3346 stop:4116 length:771 start_codon:yes stop_codon:yes gene_type:complete